ncbi:MAG: hypothetical protein ACLGIK_02795 [Gemmatimonadota bacterium]
MPRRARRVALARAATLAGSVLAGGVLAIGSLASGSEPRAANGDTTSVTSSPTPAAVLRPTEGTDPPSLVGKLLGEVVPDTALLSSWAVYPVERHVGIRLALVGGRHYLLADTLVGYDGPTAVWRIRQVQAVEAPAAGEGYVGSCALPGADAADGTVVARVTLSAGEQLTPIHAAWRLDPAIWQFRPFPTDSLNCYNEGGGP